MYAEWKKDVESSTKNHLLLKCIKMSTFHFFSYFLKNFFFYIKNVRKEITRGVDIQIYNGWDWLLKINEQFFLMSFYTYIDKFNKPIRFFQVKDDCMQKDTLHLCFKTQTVSSYCSWDYGSINEKKEYNIFQSRLKHYSGIPCLSNTKQKPCYLYLRKKILWIPTSEL